MIFSSQIPVNVNKDTLGIVTINAINVIRIAKIVVEIVKIALNVKIILN